ncbi:hypothetical protein AB2M62_03615 [Sphingomonas sp. MMS12-HWE2-04]|uniref:hypothetical protein n=1 Tax=Sphingomonas sp. MMS12-HWE2-04 TaxID=3234199 RepID=UPI00384D5B40
MRAAWLGYAVARTITAVPDGQKGGAFLNHLGAKLGIDVARWWRPTARNFFDRLNKSAILDLLHKVCGGEYKARYANARKFDLAVSAEMMFAGDLIAEVEVKDRTILWVPDAMRFAPEPDAAGVEGGTAIGNTGPTDADNAPVLAGDEADDGATELRAAA